MRTSALLGLALHYNMQAPPEEWHRCSDTHGEHLIPPLIMSFILTCPEAVRATHPERGAPSKRIDGRYELIGPAGTGAKADRRARHANAPQVRGDLRRDAGVHP